MISIQSIAQSARSPLLLTAVALQEDSDAIDAESPSSASRATVETPAVETPAASSQVGDEETSRRRQLDSQPTTCHATLTGGDDDDEPEQASASA